MTPANDNLPEPVTHTNPELVGSPARSATPEKVCPQCGANVPAEVPSVLCPKCLLTLGFESQPGLQQPSTQAYRPRFVAPLPEQLAPYFPQLEILERVGYGGMGVVYKARQKELDRLVALKILRPDFEHDPGFADRFQCEARALARLNHPHIVGVYDFGKQGDLYFFLMEFVDGLSLRAVEQSGRLSPKEALTIVPQVCDALQYAHEQGVVHRDIKPENILIGKDGQVKIADFGLAKLARPVDASENEAHRPLTGTREVVGTPHYMAPEQVERPAEVDHRADIFSLGVVLYEMLTGELPLGRFPPPSQKVSIDFRLDEVVLRALEKEPAQRYQRVSEVRTDVDHIRDHELPPLGSGKIAVAKRRVRTFFADWFAPSSPNEAKSREQLEQELGIPAIALTVVGVVGSVIGLMMLPAWVLSESPLNSQRELLITMTCLAGPLSLFTGLSLKSLQNFRYGIIGCILLLVLFGVLWIASLPFAVWALWLLRHPAARGHFVDVLLSDSRAWTTLRDTATNLWSHIGKFSRTAWPMLRGAITNAAELVPGAFKGIVGVTQRKDLATGVVFLALEALWTLWCLGVAAAIGICHQQSFRQLEPRLGEAMAFSFIAAALGWSCGTIVLLRFSGRLLKATASLARGERLAAPTELLLSMMLISFVAMLISVAILVLKPFSHPFWHLSESVAGVAAMQLGILHVIFDSLILLSCFLMHRTSRTRLTRWILAFSTLVFPVWLFIALASVGASRQFGSGAYWATLVPMLLTVPAGVWAMIALSPLTQTAEPKLLIPEEPVVS